MNEHESDGTVKGGEMYTRLHHNHAVKKQTLEEMQKEWT